MEHIKTLFVMPPRAPKKGPRNERDEIFEYFYGKLAPAYQEFRKRPMSKRMLAVKIAHLSVQDLYYMRSVCEDAARRGQSFSKVFWGQLKVRPEKGATV